MTNEKPKCPCKNCGYELIRGTFCNDKCWEEFDLKKEQQLEKLREEKPQPQAAQESVSGLEYLWVVHNDSRHIPNRFTYIEPTEKVGDELKEKDPWERKVFVSKIDKYRLEEKPDYKTLAENLAWALDGVTRGNNCKDVTCDCWNGQSAKALAEYQKAIGEQK